MGWEKLKKLWAHNIDICERITPNDPNAEHLPKQGCKQKRKKKNKNAFLVYYHASLERRVYVDSRFS